MVDLYQGAFELAAGKEEKADYLVQKTYASFALSNPSLKQLQKREQVLAGRKAL